MFKPKENLKNLTHSELVKHFNCLFDNLALKYSAYNAFDNFLDCCINSLCYNYNKDVMENICKTYTQDDRYRFGEMLQIWILCTSLKVTNDNSFYDFLGIFYEEKAMSKQNGFAQYFTPMVICEFMASIVDVSADGKYVYEPTCGSGRLNLAMHTKNHKLFHYANDLDITCVKMTALNFVLHGVKGLITCDDGLFMKRAFKGAFLVNYSTAPIIEYIDNADLAYKLLYSIVPSNKPNLKINPEKVLQSDIMVDVNKIQGNSLSDLGKQLSLF